MEKPKSGSRSLFRELFESTEFVDRLDRANGCEASIDVVIPLLHSTDLWRENLLSIYREIPVSNLYVGDAGAIDRSLEILAEFPRVKIINQRHLSTLGKSIAELIQHVSTKYFAYLQSDVYLPEGWYENMMNATQEYDWVGCPMQMVVMLEYSVDYSGERPLVGSQVGRTKAFEGICDAFDDDFIYRNEEFAVASYLKRNGFRVGATKSTFHFHQLMSRKTAGDPMDIESLSVVRRANPSEESRVLNTQVYGLVKYTDPTDDEALEAFKAALRYFLKMRPGDRAKIRDFISQTNPLWIEPFVRQTRFHIRMLRIAVKAAKRVAAR